MDVVWWICFHMWVIGTRVILSAIFHSQMTSLLKVVTTLCVLSLLVGSISSCSRAPQAPHGRKGRGDNGYRIIIGDEPSGYEPGKIYNRNEKLFLSKIEF